MGCVSSSLLNEEDDFPQIGSTGFSHHFVSLTSTTYGLLTLDPVSPMTPPIPAARFTVKTPPPEATEVINSWELMAGLDSTPNSLADSFRFSVSPCKPNIKPSMKPKPIIPLDIDIDIENADPNLNLNLNLNVDVLQQNNNNRLLKPQPPTEYSVDDFPEVCPPNGGDKIVLYTTSLRGVRSTFEACNAVRSTLQLLGYSYCERDISMDRGFRDELHSLLLKLHNDNSKANLPPRLFVKGRYLGGAQEVMRIHEEGGLIQLLRGLRLPKNKVGSCSVCDGCGDARFLPCFNCNGSCKLLVKTQKTKTVIITKCPDCNENGLVLCPICS